MTPAHMMPRDFALEFDSIHIIRTHETDEEVVITYCAAGVELWHERVRCVPGHTITVRAAGTITGQMTSG
jgi:hypothetical protein